MTEPIIVAKLYASGDAHQIFCLFEDGRSEVFEFFDAVHSQREKRSAQATFVRRIGNIADIGLDQLTVDWLSCWTEKKAGGMFCELKAKKRYRISYFRYPGNRILLATFFTKAKQVETKQYRRAMQVNARFGVKPEWKMEW
ncbi:MAG: hypothetical protein WD492_15480 [Alkalispirochaeta sp.]